MILDDYIGIVKNLYPGQSVNISNHELKRNLPDKIINVAIFNAADQILENIVGSSYEYKYMIEYNQIIFTRLLEPTDDHRFLPYVSPDRRHFFNQMPNGFYMRKYE